jgi:hypothetical protein
MEGEAAEVPPPRRTGGASAGRGAAAFRPPVPVDAAALIIGRAAELERAVGPSTGLDERSLVEIGRDVGVSPEAVRHALDQYHAGLLSDPDPRRHTLIGPRTLRIERTVPGPIADVDAQLARFLRRQVFECCRRSGHRSVWRPAEGLLASVQRAGQRMGRRRTLVDVTELTAALVEVPGAEGREATVRVVIEAECRALRRGLHVAALGGAVTGGVGAAAATGAALVTGDPMPLLGTVPLAALAAGAYAGSRTVYRQRLAEVELTLQGAMDRLVTPG